MTKFVFFILMCYSGSIAQEIPTDRITDWKRPDKIAIPSSNIIYAIDYGLIGDGIVPNDKALADILAKNDSVCILFPEGSFLFENKITLKSNQSLIGAGSSNTNLVFSGGTESDFISITGTKYRMIIFPEQDIQKGTDFIVFPGHQFDKELIYLLQDNDSDKVFSDWALFSTGQMIEFEKIYIDTAFFDRRIRRDFSDDCYMEVFSPAENIVLKGFSIYNETVTDGQYSNISVRNAKDVLIECVASYKCNFSHVKIIESKEVVVRGSYFNDAHDFGGGGRGYGIVLQYATGDCLIENNAFKLLRHSILLQAGSNGNIIAYNYSISPYWSDVSLPSDAAGDLVLHGNYPYMNLFESNIFQNIVIDDSHGSNGPYNTFLRNRAENYGIFMNFSPPSDKQNFIGNEITNAGTLKGLYFLNGNGHFEYGNNVNGTFHPDGTEEVSLISLFENEDEISEKQLPSISYPIGFNEGSIPAKERFDRRIFTECDGISHVIESKSNIRKVAQKIIGYEALYELIKQGRGFSVYNFVGNEVTECSMNEIRFLPPGVYIIIIKDGEEPVFYIPQ